MVGSHDVHDYSAFGRKGVQYLKGFGGIFPELFPEGVDAGEAAFVAETARFPSKLLAARYPETPNLGDFTKDLAEYLHGRRCLLPGQQSLLSGRSGRLPLLLRRRIRFLCKMINTGGGYPGRYIHIQKIQRIRLHIQPNLRASGRQPLLPHLYPCAGNGRLLFRRRLLRTGSLPLR